MEQGVIGQIPGAPRTEELPVLDESDECTEIFSSAMLSLPEDRTSPSVPAFEVAAPAEDPPTRPVPPLEPFRAPLPSITSPGLALGGKLPPPRAPLPGMDFEDVTHVKPPVAADDDASPILLSRRKSTPPPAPTAAPVAAVSRNAAVQARRAQQGLFSRLLSLLWN